MEEQGKANACSLWSRDGVTLTSQGHPWTAPTPALASGPVLAGDLLTAAECRALPWISQDMVELHSRKVTGKKLWGMIDSNCLRWKELIRAAHEHQVPN